MLSTGPDGAGFCCPGSIVVEINEMRQFLPPEPEETSEITQRVVGCKIWCEIRNRRPPGRSLGRNARRLMNGPVILVVKEIESYSPEHADQKARRISQSVSSLLPPASSRPSSTPLPILCLPRPARYAFQ